VRSPLAVLALTVLLGGCMPGSKSATPTGKTRTVNVLVTCTIESITFTINPWVQHLDFGDAISWMILAGSGTQEVSINKKDNHWAFNDNLPLSARPNNPARAEQMKDKVDHGKPYSYTVESDCQNGTGPKIHGKIDPDMIID
jgi:hypothetical protein